MIDINQALYDCQRWENEQSDRPVLIRDLNQVPDDEITIVVLDDSVIAFVRR